MNTLELPTDTSPPSIETTTVTLASETVLVIGDRLPQADVSVAYDALRFVDPACASLLLASQRPASVIADLGLLARSPCGIELRRSLETLVMQGELRVTWVRSD